MEFGARIDSRFAANGSVIEYKDRVIGFSRTEEVD
jgi:hypothetical protein